MKNAYFHIKDAKTVGDKMVLNGNYILPATIDVKPGAPRPNPPSPGSLPDLGVPGPFKVKWILPPGGNDTLRAFAEAMGYETVEADDFSYPPPR